MFRHRENQTLKHNLRTASLLSFVAGIVNVAGFLAVHRLTTNVTGHFAFFVEEVFQFNLWQALIFFLYIFAFFTGSFVSSFLIELVHKRNGHDSYILPAVVETVILLSAGIGGSLLASVSPDTLAILLLFAMGLQNSLVTTISNATVRTTHLTGLFTDLGIELSQIFFYKQSTERSKLFSSIRLRLTIITFFFVGGITGGAIYSVIKVYCLVIAGMILLTVIAFDYLTRLLVKEKNRP